jgi:3-deoxy-7-phosphoheptulonate synthase
MTEVSNLRVERIEPLTTPDELHAQLPMSQRARRFVAQTRTAIERVLRGEDHRLLVIVGPCSIHDPAAALEYAERLAPVARWTSDDLLICMRTYFEKPRTTVGWKGLINDPHLDGSCDVAEGLLRARRLLLELADRGIATATETLDPLTPQFLGDAIAWTAIGARTTESQTHREMASGLSMPVGFKNGTDGGLEIAIQAMQAAREPHSFIGLGANGRAAVVRTQGNPHTHAVLRGGSSGPNYSRDHVEQASARLRAAGCNPRVLVDCSHGNSRKHHENQPGVLRDVASQIEQGDRVLGVMLESHLVAGNQSLCPELPLVYGQSITDACIDFSATVPLLELLALAVQRQHKHVSTQAVQLRPAWVE